MRLVVCTSTFPNPSEPNKGIYVYRRVRALARRAEVVAVAPIPYFPRGIPSARYGPYARVPSEAVLDGMPVHYPRILVTPRVGRSLYGLTTAAGLLAPLRRLIRSFRPDGLLSFWAYPDGFATVLLARHFGLPVVVGAMGCDVNNLDQHMGKRRMVGWAFRHADGALAVSHALGSRILGLGVPAHKLAVVHNGLDPSYLALPLAGDEPRESAGSPPTVLFCGRLSPEKGVITLLQAARLLLARRPGVRFQFLGDGPLRHEMEGQAIEWGIREHVVFSGEVHHGQVPDQMMKASLLCLPSVREGYPNVLLEGLACGLPIVASDVGGVPEIVTDDTRGLLVPPSQPERLAEALEQVLARTWNRRALQLGVRSRTWDDVGGDIYSAVARAIGQ